MTHATPVGTADEEWADEEAINQVRFLAELEADGAAPTARQFDIRDMQHWIDLCA